MTPLDIKAARVELGFTQQTLAEATGVSRTAICAWEKAKQPVPRWFGLALAAVFQGLEPFRASSQARRASAKVLRIDQRQLSALQRLRAAAGTATARDSGASPLN